MKLRLAPQLKFLVLQIFQKQHLHVSRFNTVLSSVQKRIKLLWSVFRCASSPRLNFGDVSIMAVAYLHQIRLVSLKVSTSSGVILKKYIAIIEKLFHILTYNVELCSYNTFIYLWCIWTNLFLFYETTILAV